MSFFSVCLLAAVSKNRTLNCTYTMCIVLQLHQLNFNQFRFCLCDAVDDDWNDANQSRYVNFNTQKSSTTISVEIQMFANRDDQDERKNNYTSMHARKRPLTRYTHSVKLIQFRYLNVCTIVLDCTAFCGLHMHTQITHIYSETLRDEMVFVVDNVCSESCCMHSSWRLE